MYKKTKKLVCLIFMLTLCTIFTVPAYASGDVASAVQSTWTAAAEQIKSVVNNVTVCAIIVLLNFNNIILVYHFSIPP